MKTTQIFNLALGLLCSCVVQAQSTTNVMNAAQFQRDFASVMPTTAPKGLLNTTADFNYNKQKYRLFKRVRNGGIVLTSLGGVLLAAGVYAIANTGDGDVLFWPAPISLGTLATGGGIAMWVIGNNKMKKYGGGQMSIKPTKNGIGLAYKF